VNRLIRDFSDAGFLGLIDRAEWLAQFGNRG
jgi:hypothetical protein